MAKLVLTGASGRVGSILRPALRRRFSVLLVDRAPVPGRLYDGETFAQGDLLDAGFVDAVVTDTAAIVHLAGDPDPATSWPALATGTLSLTAVLLHRAAQDRVQHVVIGSSVHVLGGYDDPAAWPVASTAPPNPCCAYGSAKVCVEAMAQWYSSVVPEAGVTCLRLGLAGFPVRWRGDAQVWLSDQDLRSHVQHGLDRSAGLWTEVSCSTTQEPRFQVADTLPPGAADPSQPWPDLTRLAAVPPQYPRSCRLWQRAVRAAERSPSAEP